jgi:hypothetical protein
MTVPSARSRCIRPTTLLAVVALLVVPASAHARTYRFGATTDVAVSFGLSPRESSGTLIRFARNRLELTRDRGALTLKAGGRRAQRLALPATGTTRVRVELSTGTGTARLRVGRKTASMAGGFVAEDEVAVRSGRLVVSLRIHTAAPSPAHGHPTATAPPATGLADPSAHSAEVSPGGDAPAPTPPAPTPPAPTAPAPIFAPDSIWNAPLADDAALDPSGAQLVHVLQDTVAQNEAARTGPWIATNESGVPLYRVPASQPLVRVQLHTGWWGASLQTAFEAVPVPQDARPGTGWDAHMVVWQPSTDRYWEFFHMRKLSDGWHADYGGAIENVSQSSGYFSEDSWPGLSENYWGATATSLPLAGGLMRIDELQAGKIPHALALVIPYARPRAYAWPAQRTDGSSDDPAGVPEGARFRLDPHLDLSKLRLPPMTRMMAQAAQRYGLVVVDQTGWAVGFRAEDNTPTGTDPYYGPGGLFGGQYPNDLLASFPWDHLQLLRMDLGGG